MINGKFKVIDSHCHIYPEKIAGKAVPATDRFYDVTSYCDGTVGMLLEEGQKAGIDHFLVQSVATTPHQVKSINEFIAQSVRESDGKMTGLGTLHPDSEDQEADVLHLIELGLKGVKLHPDIQGFKIDDYRCLKIYELCEKYHLPILFHTGDYRYDNSNPNRLKPVLDIYQGLTVIGAHFGGWSIYEEATKAYKDVPNFYVDCSSSFYYIDKPTAKRLIETYGTDRVMFATDYPMWNPSKELEFFMSLGFSDEDYEKMLYKNAAKLFDIKL
ncbi:MAG: amidohydrolase [Clostridia bacterium]|nr:amidohydrolase [Clostridia bacterium]